MIPLHLSIEGFLSYRQRVELDFSTFELACISGPNGAGKSSLLDAITWALFGQARRRDEALINIHPDVDAAEVTLTFAYEGNVYRVQRANPKGKTSSLEFMICQSNDSARDWDRAAWKTLTERTLRDTQARVEETLRMNYETFVNASFFLQGKADQFTQQRPGDRKRILGSILGLEIWETYRSRAFERRKAVEREMTALDGRMAEIETELSEETQRKDRLAQLEAELERLGEARSTQERLLENIRQVAARLAEQRRLLDTFARGLAETEKQLESAQNRLQARTQEREKYNHQLEKQAEIEAAYQAWQQARHDVEYWDGIAKQFQESEKQRQEPLNEINAARARLTQEKTSLEAQRKEVEEQAAQIENLSTQIESLQVELEGIEERLTARETLETELAEARTAQAEARAENPRLKAEMDRLKERIDRLDAAGGATCPVCGQPLSPEDRARMIEDLNREGKQMGDRYRANQALMSETDEIVSNYEAQISSLAAAEGERLKVSNQLSTLQTRREAALEARAHWQQDGAPRLQEVAHSLEQESFADEARQRLAEVNSALKEIGYDAAAHDAARKNEQAGRESEDELRNLERARAALEPLEREIGEIGEQIESLQAAAAQRRTEHDKAAAQLAAAEARAPDLDKAEADLLQLQENENRARMEVGAARQKVLVLKDLRQRQKSLQAERSELARQSGRLRVLERAFGKDGVPALLIEQALPEIESRANEILDRLSAGGMSVRFITQAAYKDKRRDDLKETLDIQISDSAGVRDYEMYSGGEAFRVNFAIRLALSEVLAQRAGARLQSLVIDEGFGSQDALGRQRLIEAINMVKPDFELILVITHIEELKDAFPTRIEVEKTPQGSALRVV